MLRAGPGDGVDSHRGVVARKRLQINEAHGNNGRRRVKPQDVGRVGAVLLGDRIGHIVHQLARLRQSHHRGHRDNVAWPRPERLQAHRQAIDTHHRREYAH